MQQQKRIPPEPPASAPAQTIKKKMKEEIPMPVPVSPGPVQPPAPKRAWWVLVVIVFFVVASIVALSVSTTHLTLKALQGNNTSETQSEGESKKAEEEDQTPRIYSYLSVVKEVNQETHYRGTPGECWDPSLPIEAPFLETSTPTAPLRFIVETISDRREPYADEGQFRADLARIARFADVANKHKLSLTIYFGSLFTAEAERYGITELADWVRQGHEIALWFDPGLAFNALPHEVNEVPYGSWLRSLHEEQEKLETLCNCEIKTWSGGIAFTHIFDVGYDLNFIAHTEEAMPLVAAQPWTPEDGGEDLSVFDPLGALVYIPQGVYPEHCGIGSRVPAPYSSLSLSFVSKALYETMEETVEGRVNVFRTSLFLSDMENAVNDEEEMAALDSWLLERIDPLIKSKTLLSSRTSDVAEAYFTWIDASLGRIEFVEK